MCVRALVHVCVSLCACAASTETEASPAFVAESACVCVCVRIKHRNRGISCHRFRGVPAEGLGHKLVHINTCLYTCMRESVCVRERDRERERESEGEGGRESMFCALVC